MKPSNTDFNPDQLIRIGPGLETVLALSLDSISLSLDSISLS